MGVRRGPKLLWVGDKLAHLRKDYENHKLSLIAAALRNNTDIGTMGRLATQHGWNHRFPYRTKRLRGAHRAKKLHQRVLYLEAKVAQYSAELAEIRAGLAPKKIGYIPHPETPNPLT